MNNKILYAVIAVLAVLCIVMGTVMITDREEPVVKLTNSGDTAVKENTLIVKGDGKVSIKPDVAYINIGVETLDMDAKKAQNDNSTIMEKIIKKVKSMGITEKDIQTSSYNIRPKYDYSGNKEKFIGYQVENMLKITMKKVDKVGEILNAASQEGANRVYGISFGILDNEKAYQDALKNALDNAKSKAKVMADKAGVKMKKIVAIYEGGAPQNIYKYNTNIDMGLKENKSMMDAGASIEAGELEVNAYVDVVYQVD